MKLGLLKLKKIHIQIFSKFCCSMTRPIRDGITENSSYTPPTMSLLRIDFSCFQSHLLDISGSKIAFSKFCSMSTPRRDGITKKPPIRPPQCHYCALIFHVFRAIWWIFLALKSFFSCFWHQNRFFF